MSFPRGKLQHQGVLKGHYKAGRIYRPPLLAYSETRRVDWVREDLPDLLWPAALIAQHGDEGGIRFGRLQQAVVSQLVELGQDLDEVALDGRLTSLEVVSATSRLTLLPIVKREITRLNVLPAPLLAALRLYPGLPGAWLLVDPWSHLDPGLASEDALDFLAGVIVSLIRDEHKQALLKFVPFAWRVICQKITMHADMIEVLKKYPGDRASTPLADSLIRASFGSLKGADYASNPELQERHAAWAAAFWRQNWHLSACLPEEAFSGDSDGGISEPQTTDSAAETSEGLLGIVGDDSGDRDLARELVAATVGHFNRFLEHSLNPPAEIDLYRPARHEVISGLLTRAARAVMAHLRAPHQWSGEHGSALTRLLAETEILLTWLAVKGPDLYEKYQDYGLGKAKLMKNHMSGLAESFLGSPPAELSEALAHFEKKLGGSWGEGFVEVNLDSTFAGITIRQMAIEAGLKELYDSVYQSTSGVTHGEWWAIEDYTMQRCLNPLHRYHLIPSLDPVFPTREDLGRFWVRRIDDLVRVALSHLDAGSQAHNPAGDETGTSR